jgi:MarR family 2-MHQ and catechol resistance regulon transcriptional repressor
MTAAVDRLEKRGFVRRIQAPSDGRCFYIHLTEIGRRVISSAYAQHEKKLEKIVGILTPEERAELVRLLKKMGQHAQKILSK